MNRRGLGLVVAIALLLCGCTQTAMFPAPPAPYRRPNIVLIFADDQGYNDMGCFGAPGLKTPRLDRMAAEGIRFTDFHVAAPVCSPSRAALLTGCYPQRVSLGVAPIAPNQSQKSDRVFYPDSPYGLNPNEITVAQLLKQSGYATEIIGKWHLGDAPEMLPIRHGFDSWYGLPYSNDMKPCQLWRNDKPIEDVTDQSILIDRYTDEAKRFIKSHRDQPFFLYLAHTMPHRPLSVAARFRGKSERGLYGDVIQALDWSTGEILDTLKEQSLDRDTLVIYTSDNGPWLTMGEMGGLPEPFRAGKGSTYEGGMREPCIMRWPAQIPAGRTCKEMAVTFDLLPTFAHLAGAKVPDDRIIDGKDISDLMTDKPGATSPHDRFYYYCGNDLQAVRSGKWKLRVPTMLADESGRYVKLQHNDTPIPPALYNLDFDPAEQKNVLKDHPDIVQRLQKMAAEAREDLGDAVTGAKGKNVRPMGEVANYAASTQPATKP